MLNSLQNPRLLILVGSVRQGRFGPTIARWTRRMAEESGQFDLDVLDLADHPELFVPGPAGAAPEAAEALAAVAGRLAAADAFVVVTPEYNHSYPAALKGAIDMHFKEWQAKPVAFVSYGGVSGGLRAVEHLRAVFAELHAVTIRNTVSFHGGAGVFDAEGEPVDCTGPQAAAKALFGQLAWWAAALGEAREKHPYEA